MKQKYFNTLVLALLALGAFSCKRANGPLATVTTLAGHTENLRFRDPFGVAVAKDGAIYVSDGDTGQIWQLDEKGAGRLVAQGLNTPSGLAVDKNGQLIVAETGAHTIKRINPQNGAATLVAGQENNAGHADGDANTAQFNGPIGLAIAADDTIYVADTYNDRIRAIGSNGKVRTVAGEGATPATSFNTPCAILVRPDGQLIVADTGNNRLRMVSSDGSVAGIAGNGEDGGDDGPPSNAKFNQPTALAMDDKGFIYVADASGAALRMVVPANATNAKNPTGLQLIGAYQDTISADYSEVKTLVGAKWRGLADGALSEARISRPSGLAFTKNGELIVTDTGNRLVRVVKREGQTLGATLMLEQARALRPKPEDFRKLAPPRWPYEPAERPREIAATFGELRGEVNKPDEGVWFHNGLDIPGGAGETVRAVREEKALLPLSVQLFDTKREYIRFPTMGYIHLRIGRDQNDKPFDDPRFLWQRDDNGKLIGVRVRRGAQLKAGDAIGTLNNQFHVHLIAGPTGGEMNALAALELPGVKDTKPPVIESVEFYSKDWQPFAERGSGGAAERQKGNPLRPIKPEIPNPPSAILNLTGEVRIVARAYDQMDGNAARRRLGAYRLGYQILKADGSPAEGYAEPLVTISFETLPDDDKAGLLTYSPGSMCGYTPATILGYIVTNKVRDREAHEDFWQTSKLPAGNYKVSVFAEDFFGNRSTRDINVSIR